MNKRYLIREDYVEFMILGKRRGQWVMYYSDDTMETITKKLG